MFMLLQISKEKNPWHFWECPWKFGNKNVPVTIARDIFWQAARDIFLFTHDNLEESSRDTANALDPMTIEKNELSRSLLNVTGKKR